MTPKEKAEEILLKHSIYPDGNNELVIKASLITVNEILNFILYESVPSRNFDFYSKVNTEIIKISKL